MKLADEILAEFTKQMRRNDDPERLASIANNLAQQYAEKIIRVLVGIRSMSVYMDGSHSAELDTGPMRRMVNKAFPNQRFRGDSMEHLIKVIIEEVDK